MKGSGLKHLISLLIFVPRFGKTKEHAEKRRGTKDLPPDLHVIDLGRIQRHQSCPYHAVQGDSFLTLD